MQGQAQDCDRGLPDCHQVHSQPRGRVVSGLVCAGPSLGKECSSAMERFPALRWTLSTHKHKNVFSCSAFLVSIPLVCLFENLFSIQQWLEGGLGVRTAGAAEAGAGMSLNMLRCIPVRPAGIRAFMCNHPCPPMDPSSSIQETRWSLPSVVKIFLEPNTQAPVK